MHLLSLLIGRIIALLSMPIAFAQTADPCLYVGGCGGSNVLLNFLTPIAQLLIGIAGGATVLFVVLGGAQMMLSFGDEGKVTKGRMSIVYAIGGFLLVLSASMIANFVRLRAGYIGAGDPFLDLMAAMVDGILTLFNAVFIIMVIFAGYRMVVGRGQAEEFNKGKTMLIWVAAGAIIINVARALVNAIYVGLA